MRRGTLLMIVLLFALLVGVAVYQLTAGGRDAPTCGPASPNGLPTLGACPSLSPVR